MRARGKLCTAGGIFRLETGGVVWRGGKGVYPHRWDPVHTLDDKTKIR
jgi:hypothetical protein